MVNKVRVVRYPIAYHNSTGLFMLLLEKQYPIYRSEVKE